MLSRSLRSPGSVKHDHSEKEKKAHSWTSHQSSQFKIKAVLPNPRRRRDGQRQKALPKPPAHQSSPPRLPSSSRWEDPFPSLPDALPPRSHLLRRQAANAAAPSASHLPPRVSSPSLSICPSVCSLSSPLPPPPPPRVTDYYSADAAAEGAEETHNTSEVDQEARAAYRCPPLSLSLTQHRSTESSDPSAHQLQAGLFITSTSNRQKEELKKRGDLSFLISSSGFSLPLSLSLDLRLVCSPSPLLERRAAKRSAASPL